MAYRVRAVHACSVCPCLVDDDGTLYLIPKERCGGGISVVGGGGGGDDVGNGGRW